MNILYPRKAVYNTRNNYSHIWQPSKSHSAIYIALIQSDRQTAGHIELNSGFTLIVGRGGGSYSLKYQKPTMHIYENYKQWMNMLTK